MRAQVKPFHVRNHLWIFVNCLIENPAFDSQTKDTLTTKQGKFGSRCEVTDTPGAQRRALEVSCFVIREFFGAEFF